MIKLLHIFKVETGTRIDRVVNIRSTGGGSCNPNTIIIFASYITSPRLIVTMMNLSRERPLKRSKRLIGLFTPSRSRECDEVDGGSCISAKHASSSLSSKILSCADGDCGLVNSGMGGSGDSPSTGERSGASWAVATACLTADWAVGVGTGGGGSSSARCLRAVGDEREN